MWQSYILTSTALVRHSNWANEWLCCVSPVSNQLWHAIGGTDPWPSQHVADTHIKYYLKIDIPAFGSSSAFHFWLKRIFWKLNIFQQVYRPEASAAVDKTLGQWNGGLIYSWVLSHSAALFTQFILSHSSEFLHWYYVHLARLVSLFTFAAW